MTDAEKNYKDFLNDQIKKCLKIRKEVVASGEIGVPYHSPEIQNKLDDISVIERTLSKELSKEEWQNYLYKKSPCYSCRFNSKLYDDSICYHPNHPCCKDPNHSDYQSNVKGFDYYKQED